MPCYTHLVNDWRYFWMAWNCNSPWYLIYCSAYRLCEQGVFPPSIMCVGSWLAWRSCAWPWWAQEPRAYALRVTFSHARTCSHHQCCSRSLRTWAERGFMKSAWATTTMACPSTAACTETLGEWPLVLCLVLWYVCFYTGGQRGPKDLMMHEYPSK